MTNASTSLALVHSLLEPAGAVTLIFRVAEPRKFRYGCGVFRVIEPLC